MDRRAFLALGTGLAAQEPGEAPVDFVCPMDPEVHSKTPGRCPRCGMRLEAGLPQPREFRLRVETTPAVLETGRTAMLRFEAIDPQNGRRVRRFREIHEKLFHLFLISEDLRYFAHEHPELEPDGRFRFHFNPPLPGIYRLLADFFPEGGTPQLLPAPLYVRGEEQPFRAPGLENLSVKLTMEPAQPLAGQRTMLFFHLEPFAGVRPWLGAWGHLLTASEDLLDLVHAHPVWEPYGNRVQFNVIFPRPGRYLLWAQFDRNGAVNTASVSVEVGRLG
jgi:hypothetical protein